MANRCENCCKFVSLETPEPEEEGFDYEITEDGVLITACLTQNRECAECGTPMKCYSHELEESYSWLEIGLDLDKLTEEQKADLAHLWDNSGEPSTFSIDVESGGTSVEEGGGGRYAKNMITSSLEAIITIKHPSGLDISLDVTLSDAVAASEFDEC